MARKRNPAAAIPEKWRAIISGAVVKRVVRLGGEMRREARRQD